MARIGGKDRVYNNGGPPEQCRVVAKIAVGTVITVPCLINIGFKLTPAMLEAAITPKIK